MTSIFFDEARLKTYSAISRGGKSTIKIEVETTDHFELGSILRQLDKITADQKPKPKPKAAVKETEKPLLALPAPALQLPYFGDDQ